ncbi:DUF305 domain-containing protein [Streptomyces sp. Ag109_O5-10]|uniref:DUF305 domain-containing protein n=1 Tax=Streptomyces sp. Ag109_O5-10 TaxID=1855349 RepID=UPI000897B721|nr:DUF305 domain-containing protein [Streptomyces sp. Ag109_O5-10]SEF15292.1 Uncharacterized conserved protein, DUF305 family [Streptomyces sp. Ag109_O5-10]
MTSTRTRAVLVALTVTAALALTACGSGDDGADATHASHSAAAGATASATAGAHNAQDVSFAQSMIPHHQQALEMAGLAVDRGSSAQVRGLAARIEKAQDPEIRTMTGWLKAWGEDVPMAGMDHSGHAGMAGMMSDKDMTMLKQARGTDFDSMFLTMMVEHHRGAVEMAGTEKAKGAYGPATSMADAIVTAQNAEIKEMNKLLGKG